MPHIRRLSSLFALGALLAGCQPQKAESAAPAQTDAQATPSSAQSAPEPPAQAAPSGTEPPPRPEGDPSQIKDTAKADPPNAAAPSKEPCVDTDRDGLCDDVDPHCNTDGSKLLCRRLGPRCPEGTVPEIRQNYYTDRCVTWADCQPD